MEFTKENVLHNWLILNTSQDIKLKSSANSHLTLFKQCVNVIPICGELFKTTTEQSVKFFSSLIIYQHIKENISNIVEEKALFNEYKQFLFTTIFPLIQNCSEIVISNVCQSIAIIVLVGKVTYWIESIDDILQLGDGPEFNCLCAIMILGSFYQELEEMKLETKLSIKIRVECIESREKVKLFLISILNKVRIDNSNKHEIMFKHLLDMTLSWIKFKMNILSIDNYPIMLINSLNKDYRAKISEVLSDCFQYSSISVSWFMSKYPNEMIFDILSKHTDRNELNIVYQMIMIINNLCTSYTKQLTSSHEVSVDDVLFQIANIFSSLSKNYIYLFFLPDNDTSTLLWSLFFFFISIAKRKVSYLFFESIEEMKNIINQHKFLELYSQSQKDTYKDYLFKINDAILSRAKLTSLEVNYKSIEEKESIINLNGIDILESIEEDDMEGDSEDITKSEYRKAAEDALSDIFLIFLYNFANGIQIYFERLGSMLMTQSNHSIDVILNNKDYLILVEVVLFNIRSIRYCFDLPGIDSSLLLNFSNFILNSQLVKNEKIMVTFIMFLDSISLYVNKNPILNRSCIQFLLSVILQFKVLEKISALVLLNIIDNATEFDDQIHNTLHHFYFKEYSNISSNAISHLSEGLLKNIIKSKNTFTKEDISSFVVELLKPVSLNNNTSNSINYHTVMKIIEIYSTITKTIGSFHKDVLYDILTKDKSIFSLCNSVIVEFCNDSELIKSIVLLYVKLCYYLKEHCLNFFNEINNIIFSIYSSSNETYEVIYIMKVLYVEAIKDQASPYCKEVIEKFCAICLKIHDTLYSISKNKLEMIQLFASFMSLMFEHIQSFPLDYFDYNIMDKVVNMFIDCNKGIVQIELNANVIKLFGKICSKGIIPIDFKLKFIGDFVKSVIINLQHYDSSSIRDIAILFIEARNINTEVFNKEIRLNIEKDIAKLIEEYFILYGNINSKTKIERLVMDLIDIKKGIKKGTALNVYCNELKIIKMRNMNQQ